MVIFYKKWKKYNEFQLTKNKMDLNIRKMTNHPPSPVLDNRSNITFWYGTNFFIIRHHYKWEDCELLQLDILKWDTDNALSSYKDVSGIHISGTVSELAITGNPFPEHKQDTSETDLHTMLD